MRPPPSRARPARAPPAARPDPLAALAQRSERHARSSSTARRRCGSSGAGACSAPSLRFDDAGALRDACVRLAARAGRRLDDAQPMVDARLADGSRLNVVLAAARSRRPAADAAPLRAAAVHAGRARRARLALGRPTPRCSTRCVRARLAIVISGGTSSGKTSLLGALAARIDAAERIVTVEDAAELRIDRPHVARLEARGASLEGQRRGRHPRAGAQCAADAARPARRRRGPRRRGARHAPGDDDRARRFAHDRARQESRTTRCGGSSCSR